MQGYFLKFIALLKDDSAAVLVEYATTMALISLVAFKGYVHVAEAVIHLYQNDTTGMQNITNSFYSSLP